MREQGQASLWDTKQDELSGSSCQLPSPLLICWSVPRPAWNDAEKGHHGWSYTPLPIATKQKRRTETAGLLENPPRLFQRNQNSDRNYLHPSTSELNPGVEKESRSKGKRTRSPWTQSALEVQLLTVPAGCSFFNSHGSQNVLFALCEVLTTNTFQLRDTDEDRSDQRPNCKPLIKPRSTSAALQNRPQKGRAAEGQSYLT